MSNIQNSSNKKGEEQNNDYLEIKISANDLNFQKNSVMLKDMIFVNKNDKISQILNPHNRNNIIMQKWIIQESQRNQQNQNNRLKALDFKEEYSSPQKERRFSQTSIGQIKESKVQSPKKSQEGSQNLLDQDIKKQHQQNNIQEFNKGSSQRSEIKQNAQDVVKTIELHLDTNDRYKENLNRTNFFTERTSSLIEMNKRKRSKQKSQQKSPPQETNQNDLPENEYIRSSPAMKDGNFIKKLEDGVNSNFFRTHFSNLLTNQKSNKNLIGQDNQFVNSKNSRQLLKTLIVFDNGSRKRDDIRGSVLNKSDNEITIGKWSEQDKKEQNMTQSEIYNISGEKHVQPKRKLLEFPQKEQQQVQNLIQNKNYIKKPFMSGAQSHNNAGFNGLPTIKTNYKKNSQSPFKFQQDLQINEGYNNKNQQTIVSDYLNKTIYSPNPQNGSDTLPINDGNLKNKQHGSNNNISSIFTQTQANNDIMNKFCDVPNGNQQKDFTQLEFYQTNQLSPLIFNHQKAKSSSVNQQRNNDFIQLNKKNLKFIGNKKKTPYNQIVDSILKQHDIKEKDDKKAEKKEKRRKLQQIFKHKFNTNTQISIDEQQQNFNKNLTTTIGSEFGNQFYSNNPSPDVKGDPSITHRNDPMSDSNAFQPQGQAYKNKLLKEKNQSPYQHYLEKQIELEQKRQTSQRFQKQNPQTSINFFPKSETFLQNGQNGEPYIVQQFNISYQQQQQFQFKRRMRNMSNQKQRQLTVEDQMISEQLKQKIINIQQQKATIQSSNFSPSNMVATTLINDSKILNNNSYLNSNITGEQLQMTQNLQKQASLIKKQQQLAGLNNDQQSFIQNALNNAGQSMLYIKKWKGELPRQNYHDNNEWHEHKKSTTAAGARQKENKQHSSDFILIDEDQFSVNYRPKYNHEKTELNSSKKRIKSQNGPRVNASHDLAQYIKNRNKEISPKFKNEIQPWDTSGQQQYDEEEDDMCIHSKI